MTAGKPRLWVEMFAAAALFNFAIGIPLMLARHWTLALTFRPEFLQGDNLAPHLWSDFGYCVALIGVGYLIVAFDITRNRALVWLGIFAKAYDVVILTWRFLIDITRPIVLVPAAIDAAFILLFCGSCMPHGMTRNFCQMPRDKDGKARRVMIGLDCVVQILRRSTLRYRRP